MGGSVGSQVGSDVGGAVGVDVGISVKGTVGAKVFALHILFANVVVMTPVFDFNRKVAKMQISITID